MYKWLFLSVFTLLSFTTDCQSFYFGPKAGLTVASQKWDTGGGNRNPLLSIHGDVFMETVDTEGKGSFFGQLGFHTRGSSITYLNTLNFDQITDGYKFNNLVLNVGVKKRFKTEKKPTYYYGIGLRGEYTLFTNLSEFQNRSNPAFYPIDEFVRPFVYGISLLGGIEYKVSEFVQPFIEFSINPDLAAQYNQFQDFQVVHPYTGQLVTVRAKEIRNVSFEITVGVKFLRKVVYY